MTADWSGVFPAVTTKFKDDHSLDLEATEEHLEAQIEAGVHGLIMLGTLGESASLSTEEKHEVVQTALSVSDGRVPVLAGVAETTTAAACEFVERGASYGADGFMLLPGLLYHSDRRETLRHFRTVAQVSERPLMIYNNPVAYDVDTTPEMFAELAEEETIVAIKESSNDVRRITDLINRTGDRYQLFCGVDDLALESLLMGVVGWVAGLVNAFPEETVAIYELATAGRIEEAREIYRWFAPLLHLDVSTKLVQNIKLAEAMVGIGTEPVRPPRLPLAGEERTRVKQIIEQGIENRPDLDAYDLPNSA
jgi:4-hydroxy-tetrahydrodipicolinate synthase